MIDFEHVTKVYETQNDENVALGRCRHPTLMKGNSFLSWAVPSGAGQIHKSSNWSRWKRSPTEGKIYINDHGPGRPGQAPQRCLVCSRQIGAVFQDFRLIPHHDGVRERGFVPCA